MNFCSAPNGSVSSESAGRSLIPSAGMLLLRRPMAAAARSITSFPGPGTPTTPSTTSSPPTLPATPPNPPASQGMSTCAGGSSASGPVRPTTRSRPWRRQQGGRAGRIAFCRRPVPPICGCRRGPGCGERHPSTSRWCQRKYAPYSLPCREHVSNTALPRLTDPALPATYARIRQHGQGVGLCHAPGASARQFGVEPVTAIALKVEWQVERRWRRSVLDRLYRVGQRETWRCASAGRRS